jgi:hypothetical protein
LRKSTEKRIKAERKRHIFRILDQWWRAGFPCRESGEPNRQPPIPKVDGALFKAWKKTYDLRYRRSTALHEAGHSVVAEILLPNFVKEVRLGADRVELSDWQRQILSSAGHKVDSVDGQVIYKEEQLLVESADLHDCLSRRVAVTLAGILSQVIEGFEAFDIDLTKKIEEEVVAKTLDQFNETELPLQSREAVRAEAEQLLPPLLSSEAVRQSIAEVADALCSAGTVPGSTVTQIVERNCPADFLECARYRRPSTDAVNALGEGVVGTVEARNAGEERG